MTELEIDNLIQLARSYDEESNKLAIALLEQAYPDKLTYEEYLKTYQNWIYTPTMEYINNALHYRFIWCGYMPYLGIPVYFKSKEYKINYDIGEHFYSETKSKLCTDG